MASRKVDAAALGKIAAAVSGCTRCPLHEERMYAVPGEGTGSSGIVLVGEAPGRKEDESGRPFCGAAGKNLDLGLAAAALDRDAVFVTSIVKCRPPGNRDPKREEKASCRDYLLGQVGALQPTVLVALGRHGLSGLTGAMPKQFSDLRGTFVAGPGGVPVFVSLHPAAIIYRRAWRDVYLDDWRALGAWIRGEAPPPGGDSYELALAASRAIDP